MRFLLSIFFLLTRARFASKRKKIDTTEYSSEVDDDLTIRNVSLLPSHDNIRGIYSKSVDEQLKIRIQNNHHWEYVPAPVLESKVKPEDLVGQPKKVKSFASRFKADAFLQLKPEKIQKGWRSRFFSLVLKVDDWSQKNG